jgi:type IV pilus assembly protein PilY1
MMWFPESALGALRRASLGAALLTAAAFASATDISTIPPTLQTSGAARTNLMFILDDSTSMSWDYMPDAADTNNRCFGFAGFNKVFFDPNKSYPAPVRADGTSFPNATWPTVYNDGYLQSGGTTTLNSNALGPFSKNSERFYYTTRNPNSATTACTNSEYALVQSLTTAQQQNYANWYSFYRTRMLTMRAGVGRAFANIDATKVRIGFSTISYTGATDGAEFLNVREFDLVAPGSTKTQKELFYEKLYSAVTSGPSGSTNYTPLRPALVKAGRYFANKVTGQTDPVEYSCQRNYSILSTDGYWNLNASGSGGNEPANYAPPQVDGTTPIGNQDGGSTARPYREGAAAVSGSLSDIAMYYYGTDLRTDAFGNCTGALNTNVCANNVLPAGSRDTATHQHMTTFTIGLGVNGNLVYERGYETATSGDYFDIKAGTKDWPDPNVTNTAVSGSSLTPRVDDLWHAAVNGRGTYFSAANAGELADSLTEALDTIGKDPGTGAAAGSSSLRPVSGDDKVFVAKYTPGTWNGSLESFTVNTTTGALNTPTTANWEAGALLKTRDLTTSPRNIWFFTGAGATKLASFSHSNLSATQKAYFDNLCTSPAKLAQCASLNTNALAKVTGANVVDYLAGKTTYELSAAAADNRVFRTRVTPLGDFVNASPIYVKKPPFLYADAGYASYKAAQALRTGVVYAAANDGMLHAFNASNGQELWAYVPSMVMSNMYRLVDRDYGQNTNHRYFVDATPVMGDVFDGTNWRTVLIGGLGAGGRGYYALDITDPANPIGLWEFTDTHLGLTYGNPVITKLKNGTWAVLLTSGYDNNAGSGDGNGRLFVVNAVSGAPIGTPIQTYTDAAGTTAAGTTGTPNNVGKFNVWIDDETNNTAKRAYAGDMLGNLWRFDFDDNILPSGNEAFLLAQARAANGTTVQPITVRPQLTEVGANKAAAVVFGTGRYLGQADMTDTTLQSVYVVKDDLSTTSLGVLRSSTAMVKQTMSTSHTIANPLTVDWAAKSGWYVDLDVTSKERVTVDMQLQFNTLTVAANIPTATACSPGGTSQVYDFNVRTGAILQSQSFDAMTMGITTVLVGTEGGQAGTGKTQVTDATGRITTIDKPGGGGGGALLPRRTSWRELIN